MQPGRKGGFPISGATGIRRREPERFERVYTLLAFDYEYRPAFFNSFQYLGSRYITCLTPRIFQINPPWPSGFLSLNCLSFRRHAWYNKAPFSSM